MTKSVQKLLRSSPAYAHPRRRTNVIKKKGSFNRRLLRLTELGGKVVSLHFTKGARINTERPAVENAATCLLASVRDNAEADRVRHRQETAAKKRERYLRAEKKALGL